MAATNAGLSNPLGSPREFGSPRTPRTMRMNNVFQAGQPRAANGQPREPLQGPPLRSLNTLASPTSPQTRKSLWNPLHEPSEADALDDYFEHAVGGAKNSIKDAGFGRIKKRSNKTECAFYRELAFSCPELAPEFHGVHMSDGKQWNPYIVLEDLTVGFSKPQILDVQIGATHVGSGEAGDTNKVALRINGMQRFSAQGRERMSKLEGASVTRDLWGDTIENFLRDESGTMRDDVARAAVAFIDQAAAWVEGKPGLRLTGSSIFIVYEADASVDSPKTPVVKMMDFEYCEDGSSPDPDHSYLTGVRNLKWMLKRFGSHVVLSSFGAKAVALKQESAQTADQLRVNSEHARKLAQVASNLAPKSSNPYANRLLYEDIREAAVSRNVEAQQDNCLAALLNALLLRHGVNAGPDAMVELLEWKLRPMITDRTFLKEMMNKFAFDDHPALLDDLMKWKASDDAQLRESRPIIDVNLSAASELPSFKDLLSEECKVNLVQN